MNPDNKQMPVDREVIDRILNALSGLRYGSVHIIIQDYRIIQIDKTEKVRFGDEGYGRKHTGGSTENQT